MRPSQIALTTSSSGSVMPADQPTCEPYRPVKESSVDAPKLERRKAKELRNYYQITTRWSQSASNWTTTKRNCRQ